MSGQIPTYDDIAKNQKTIEENFVLIKKSFEEAEKKIYARRSQIITAIQQEQAIEASKLTEIVKMMQNFISSSDLSNNPSQVNQSSNTAPIQQNNMGQV